MHGPLLVGIRQCHRSRKYQYNTMLCVPDNVLSKKKKIKNTSRITRAFTLCSSSWYIGILLFFKRTRKRLYQQQENSHVAQRRGIMAVQRDCDGYSRCITCAFARPIFKYRPYNRIEMRRETFGIVSLVVVSEVHVGSPR